MQRDCNVVIPHSFFLEMLPNKQIMIETQAKPVSKLYKGLAFKKEYINFNAKYQIWHLKNFTDKNKSVKWCPQPGCEWMVNKKISSDQ
jgi:hypothetical protein